MKYTLKQLVSNNEKSDFVYYRDGELIYKTRLGGFEYPVPISDIENATYNTVMKSLHMMRYIRKQIKFLDDCKNKL